VGVDVANHVREFLAKADMGIRMTGGGKTNPLRELVDAKQLGKKTGAGFFSYTTDSKVSDRKRNDFLRRDGSSSF
jgi:3-hydroxyacyl-CoA dehydrogenase